MTHNSIDLTVEDGPHWPPKPLVGIKWQGREIPLWEVALHIAIPFFIVGLVVGLPVFTVLRLMGWW